MKKRAMALVSASVLFVALLPQAAGAADDVQIDAVHTGDQTVSLRFSGAVVGDWYHLYVGDKGLYGTLSAMEAASGSKILDVSGLGPAVEGNDVRIEMKSNQPNAYLSDTVRITTGTSSELQLSLNGDLKAGGGSQRLTVTIQGDYTPELTDTVRVTAYDAGQKPLDNMQLFQVPESLGTSMQKSFHLPLTPGADVDHYKVELLRNYSNVLGEALYALHATPAPDDRLRLLYPSSIQPGAEVQGQVFLKDADGKENDVSALAMFTYDGPIAPGTFRQGNFKVSEDAKAGDTLRITAQVAGISKSITLTVGKDGTVTPRPPALDGAKEVRMTIQSDTILVDGKAIKTEVAPFITDGRTLVPIRVLAESFGATVEFDPQTYVITITQGDNVTEMKVNDVNYTINGVGKRMDRAPYIAYSGRTIVPVRFAAEGLGYHVEAIAFPDGSTKEVVFTR